MGGHRRMNERIKATPLDHAMTSFFVIYYKSYSEGRKSLPDKHMLNIDMGLAILEF